jgi:hypothetical protein
MNIGLSVLTGIIAFVQELGKPIRIWEFEVVPFWVILSVTLIIMMLVLCLDLQTEHGLKMTYVLLYPFLAAMVTLILFGWLVLYSGFPVVLSK